jgi:hypothetical protein
MPTVGGELGLPGGDIRRTSAGFFGVEKSLYTQAFVAANPLLTAI